MSSQSQKEKINFSSFPGFAKSIVRPVVGTTRTVVRRGERILGDVFGMGKHAVKNTISGTGTVASGVARRSSKVIRNVAGLATGTVKDTFSGASTITKGVVKDSKKVVRDAAKGGKKPNKKKTTKK